MTSPSARLPRDARARERLREAQRSESRALVAVYTAQARLDRARGNRDKVLAAADGAVDKAREAVTTARERLIAVSGRERCALLLGEQPKRRMSNVPARRDAGLGEGGKQ